METLEGGKLVTRHWVSWNKEDGKEVRKYTYMHRRTHIDAHTHMHTLIEDFSRC